MNSLQQIAEVLKSYDRILLTGHEYPDGDSIGSCLALGLTLHKMGKEVYLSDWSSSEKFSFLPGQGLIKPFNPNNEPQIIVYLDCSDAERVSKELEGIQSKSLPAVNIDHHISNKYFADYNFVNDSAAATGEIIFELIKYFHVAIDQEIAHCLYTAIVTDTGSFRYSNTTTLTHKITAELIETGIDVGNINRLIFEEVPRESFMVLREALSTFEISTDGKIAWIVMSNKTLRELGAKDEHTDSLINYTRMIKGVEIGLLFREVENNLVKVGLRSKGHVDVNQLAQKFGGGGHVKAAGCRIKGSLKEVQEKVLQEALKSLE